MEPFGVIVICCYGLLVLFCLLQTFEVIVICCYGAHEEIDHNLWSPKINF